MEFAIEKRATLTMKKKKEKKNNGKKGKRLIRNASWRKNTNTWKY